MSLSHPDGSPALIARAADAERLDLGGTTMTLLADAGTSDGVVNANRTVLPPRTAGPPPHYHTRSAELFFVLGGALRALTGDQVVTLDEGDFLLVPRTMPHAFATSEDAGADVLIVFTPALAERFEYFRLGERVLKGQASPQEILDSQDRFDNHFVDSPQWPVSAAQGAHDDRGALFG